MLPAVFLFLVICLRVGFFLFSVRFVVIFLCFFYLFGIGLAPFSALLAARLGVLCVFKTAVSVIPFAVFCVALLAFRVSLGFINLFVIIFYALFIIIFFVHDWLTFRTVFLQAAHDNVFSTATFANIGTAERPLRRMRVIYALACSPPFFAAVGAVPRSGASRKRDTALTAYTVVIDSH